jgi:hypothetical protein
MENKNYVHQKAKSRTVKERKNVVTNFLKGRICCVYFKRISTLCDEDKVQVFPT